jgi:hydroxymethylpyrimidine pyrophosphatase-like HAD family hydrolase
MATSYADELSAFPDTYAWAIATNVCLLSEQVDAAANRSLLAVGSGGSWTVAHFTAYLHEACTSHLSQAVTPLQLSALSPALRKHAVMLFSARGRNPDILNAASVAAESEPRELIALLLSPASPLRTLLDRYEYAASVEFSPKVSRDGFLSTNSLLGALLLIYRAYAAIHQLPELPTSFDEFADLLALPPAETILADRTLLVLFGPDTAAGAYDLESKMSEAALGHVLLSDYRDFAHGRHYWLAKRPESSAVVAFSTAADEGLVADTLQQLPTHVPQITIKCNATGGIAGILSVVGAMQLVSRFVTQARINIARPGVPSFGRRLYHSKALARSRFAVTQADVAIQRKLSASATRHPSSNWEAHYSEFCERLSRASIGGLVMDYDGTLCGATERYAGISEIATQLRRLVRLGLPVGVATGRGDSVADVLRSKLDRRHWPRILIGYYNGGHIRRLDEEFRVSEIQSDPAIDTFASLLSTYQILPAIADVKVRACQVSIRANRRADLPLAYLTAMALLKRHELHTLEVVQSSHSIDVIPRRSSKVAVVERLCAEHGVPKDGVLCVGDKGLWPGNDYRLLQAPLSLSVDEVSPDGDTCWNLAPPGWRGPQATYAILSRIQGARTSRFRLDLAR